MGNDNNGPIYAKDCYVKADSTYFLDSSESRILTLRKNMNKYAESLTASKEDTAKAMAPARADEQKAKLGLEITTQKLQLQTLKNQVEALKRVYPLDPSSIRHSIDEAEWVARSISQLEAVSAELFS